MPPAISRSCAPPERPERDRKEIMINSASALPKAVEYLKDVPDEFFCAGYLLGHVKFVQKEDGIGRGYSSSGHRSLSHALTLGIAYDRGSLDEVSQLRIWNMTNNSVYGVYYGVLEDKTPQEISATHDPENSAEFKINDGLVDGRVSCVTRVERAVPRKVAPKD